MEREEKIQEIIDYIRYGKKGIENIILENEDLFQEDRGYFDIKEKENWDSDYKFELMVELRKSFSRKLLNHLIEVDKYLRNEEIIDNKVSEKEVKDKYKYNFDSEYRKNYLKREEKIQEIIDYIRYGKKGIENIILENEDLFQEDRGYFDIKEKENWTPDYKFELMVELRKSFSRKLLNHLIEVDKYLRREGAIDNKESKYNFINSTQKNTFQKEKQPLKISKIQKKVKIKESNSHLIVGVITFLGVSTLVNAPITGVVTGIIAGTAVKIYKNRK